LYTGASVTVNSADITVRQKKVLKSDLQGLTRPKPNSRLLGIPLKLSIYNMFGNRKPNSFFGRLRDKYGEAPVLLSSVDIEKNVKVLQSHLENKGFFKAAITGDTIVKGLKGSASYKVEAGSQYLISRVLFDSVNNQLSADIKSTTAKSFLKEGAPFDLDLVKGERIRIDADLKEKGYYYFSPDYLIARVDSTNGNNTVDMAVTVKPEIESEAKQAYRINNIYIYSGYNLNTANLDTNKANSRFYDGYYVIDRRNRFKPRMFSKVIQFEPGDLYNRTDHNQTLNRLINLDEFKFVKNRFEPLKDTAKLDVYYYLTPFPKKSLRAEIDVFSTQGTANTTGNGSQVTFSWKNRNTFRGGEQLSLSAYIGSQLQFGGKQDSSKAANTFRTGAELNFAIPRFVVPFFSFNTASGYVPRTNIKLGYDILNRPKLYSVNSFRLALGYLWKESIEKQHEFYPISINYVQPLNVTKQYRDSIRKYPYLRRVVDSQFILGSTYQYTFNQLATGVQKINSFYFNGSVDISGNVAGLLMGADATAGKQKRLFNARFDQYVKLEGDFRYYRKFGLKSTWANRVILGYGNPYGNSSELPYIKQFFAGGPNSIRAFRSRTVGPGLFRDTAARNFYPDQTGDLKFEFNTEFRPHISGPLYGAVFLDAGNVWLKNESADRPGAEFTKDFLKQLAVGAGVGVRIDITLFVIRLDVAVPLRKPWDIPPSQFKNIDFKDKGYRQQNIVFNLAIGYPF
ncbi:MAG TPA: BamA/TamA family outer membrane protein, partial [Chitinophagaceae bacterium]|nr:BamA/TamA family outer membrane protein [Chitinophagaceae bacterium]